MDTYDVVIVGGGIAGLTTARDLRRSGHSVLVLEGRARLGGRTWYRRFADTDHYIEMGGTWFAEEAQSHIAEEIRRYSLPTILSPAGKELRTVLGGIALSGEDFPVPSAVRPELDRALATIVQESRRVRFGENLDDPGLRDLDVAFSEFSARLWTSPVVGDYLAMWAGFAFGCLPEELSTLHALTWVAGYGHEAWTLDAAPATKFGEGTWSLVNALAEDGAPDIAFEAPVAQIVEEAGRIRVTTLAGDTHVARAAVLATPINTWSDIEIPALSPAKSLVAAAGQAGHAVKVWALTRNIPEYLIASGWGGPLNWISEQAHFDGGRLMVGIGADASRFDPINREDVEAAVRLLAPGAEVLKFDSHDWTTDPYSKGTWAAYRPGQLSSSYAALAEPEGRLFFAGSDVARGWAGFMDGAIESGKLASKRVASQLEAEV
ncbi:MAG: NAD(P)/FAD-dependent oxidoreductase [Actinomycetes bacterium]